MCANTERQLDFWGRFNRGRARGIARRPSSTPPLRHTGLGLSQGKESGLCREHGAWQELCRQLGGAVTRKLKHVNAGFLNRRPEVRAKVTADEGGYNHTPDVNRKQEIFCAALGDYITPLRILALAQRQEGSHTLSMASTYSLASPGAAAENSQANHGKLRPTLPKGAPLHLHARTVPPLALTTGHGRAAHSPRSRPRESLFSACAVPDSSAGWTVLGVYGMAKAFMAGTIATQRLAWHLCADGAASLPSSKRRVPRGATGPAFCSRQRTVGDTTVERQFPPGPPRPGARQAGGEGRKPRGSLETLALSVMESSIFTDRVGRRPASYSAVLQFSRARKPCPAYLSPLLPSRYQPAQSTPARPCGDRPPAWLG